METEDSPLDLIGSSCYMFMLINVRRDIILNKWRPHYHDDYDDVTTTTKSHRGGGGGGGSRNNDGLLGRSRRFVAWTAQRDDCCMIGLGRLLHWIVGWMVPAIQGWLLYLVWQNMNSRAVPEDDGNELHVAEQVGVGVFLALELAPHIAQGFGLLLLPFYKRKWTDNDTPAELERKRDFVRNQWVETKRDAMNILDILTIMMVGVIELGIAGTAFWLGLESAYQQDTFVVAILRISVALFVERLDEKVHTAWKLFATPWAYKMAKEAVSEFGIEPHEKES